MAPDYSNLIIPALATLVSGSFAGFLAGLFGIGGGILTVPVLLALFKLHGVAPDTAMHLAVGTSLMTVMPTSASAFRTHFKHKMVLPEILKLWCPFLVLGAAAGTYLAQQIAGKWLGLVFGVVMLIIAVYMALLSPKPVETESAPRPSYHRTAAFIIAAIASMAGVGGGALAVPTLAAFRVPMHRAVGTASAVGFFVSIPAVILLMTMTIPPDVQLPPGCIGYVNFAAFAILAPATMLTAPYGARLAHRLNAQKLRRAFSLLLAVLAIKVVAGTWF